MTSKPLTGLVAACLILSLTACAGTASSTPPSAPSCAQLPLRLFADCPVLFAQGVSNEAVHDWGVEQHARAIECNQRLAEGRAELLLCSGRAK